MGLGAVATFCWRGIAEDQIKDGHKPLYGFPHIYIHSLLLVNPCEAIFEIFSQGYTGGGVSGGGALFVRRRLELRFLLKLNHLQLPLEFLSRPACRFTNPIHEPFEQEIDLVGQGMDFQSLVFFTQMAIPRVTSFVPCEGE